MTSSGRSLFDSPLPLSYRLPIVTEPLAPLVFEIFDLKVADGQINTQNSTSTDNKGRLKLSAREPISVHSRDLLTGKMGRKLPLFDLPPASKHACVI